MPLPVVIVEMGELPPGNLPAALLEACSDAVPRGSCVLAEPAPAVDAVYVVARVAWEDPSYRSVRIWVGVRSEQGLRSATQVISFEPADLPTERWRAVGFALGALVGNEEQAARAEAEASSAGSASPAPTTSAAPAPTTSAAPAPTTSAAPAPLPPTGSSPPAAAAQATSKARPPGASPRPAAIGPSEPDTPPHHPLALSAGALAGPGLDSGMWRFGGLLRADWCFAEVPLLVTVAGSYAGRPEDDQGLRASWLTLGGGAGACVSVDAIQLGLDARAELVAERFAPTATDAATGAEESGERWAPGLRANLDVSWPSDSIIAAVLGVDAWALSGSTTVRLVGVEAGTSRGLGVALHAGVKVELPWAP